MWPRLTPPPTPSWTGSRGRRAAAWLLALSAVVACGPADREPPSRPPVVLVIVDTLRADHLGFDGHALDTSPALDRLAAGATVFDANTTQCNSTFPSITSIFTGLYPKTHRNYLAVSVDGQAVANERAHSLAQRLGEQGYETLAVVSHPWWREAPVDTAIGRGWDAFAPIPPSIEGPARRGEAGSALATTERAFDLLDARDPTRPLFLWAHYFDPHTPYIPPPHHRDRFLAAYLGEVGLGHLHDALAALPLGERSAWIAARPEAERRPLQLALGRALYDGEIADCDEQLGRLFDRLRADGLWDDALVIVMADHGENMDPGRESIGFTHQRLYEGVVRTPLVIKRPGQTAGTRVAALSQNIDVLPTIVELLGLPPGAPMEGRSLVPLLDDPGATLHEQVFVESSDRLERALRTDDLKLIDPGDGGDAELYRWRDDAGEVRDLAAQAPATLRASLTAELAAFRPRQVLRLRAVPDERPYVLELALELDKARMTVLTGPLSATDDGRRRVVGTLTVGPEPVDVALALDVEAYEGLLRVTRPDGASLVERLVLGATPAARTDAFPEWLPGQTPSPPDASGPRVVVSAAGGVGERVVVDCAAGVAGALEVALHVGDGGLPTADRSDGLDEQPPAEGGRVRRYLRLGTQAVAFAFAPDADPALPPARRVSVTLDGRWLPFERVRLPVGGVSTSDLAVRLPRTAALGALLAEPPPDDLPPGAVALWIDTTGEAATIDVSLLDEERLEELRALGYVK